jgi:hypothetical protein
MKRLLVALLPALVALADDAVQHNSLTAGEMHAGWRLLFDGVSSNGWRGFGQTNFPAKGWVVEGGWLKHQAKGGGGDLITVDKFDDFELSWEWKLAPGANSGVKYFIYEPQKRAVGHEYQLLDDVNHPDGKIGPHRQTASLYDALPPGPHTLNPPGEVNGSRIVVRGNHVEHWLNDVKVLSYELGSPELEAAKAKSKFKDEARWGTKFSTPILLQDHGDEISFRSIKIRPIH